jgi:hypothetical protein
VHAPSTAAPPSRSVSWSSTNETASALGTMPAEFQDGPKSLSEASVPDVNASQRSQP